MEPEVPESPGYTVRKQTHNHTQSQVQRPRKTACVCARTHADQKLRSLKHCHWELFEDMLEGEDFSLILSGSWDHFGSNSQFQVFLDPSACQVALVVACQAPLSVGFSRQEYWSGLPFPSPGDLPNPRIEPESLMSPSPPLASRFFSTGATWKA